MKKFTAALLLLISILHLSACSTHVSANVPSDFYMLMDVRDPERDAAKNVNIRIHANGKVEYDIYETGGVIHYDENDVVTYEQSQIVQHGKLRLTATQMDALWKALSDTRFFELAHKYQMQIGNSYAFILVEAGGKKHTVDNIGMEVAEMRALVETVIGMLPEDVNIEYGEGYTP